MDKIRVLIADDHIVVRQGFRELLRSHRDIEVVGEASSGEEALELAGAFEPDIILMDIAMPGINGIEATKKIKKSNPAVNIIILTAYDNDEFIFACLAAKAAGYLLKNIEGDELIRSIRAVYHGDSVLHPSITRKVIGRLQSREEEKQLPKRNVISRRELEIVRLGIEGFVNKEIADRLRISERTVQTHWRNIFVKLNVSTRVEAIMICLRKKWVTLDEKEYTPG
ncbi:MAG: response regulator transcription factor [Spirochaetales bacterium]|nr:response regulator transcription factor [Spirochaetales bacterium]